MFSSYLFKSLALLLCISISLQYLNDDFALNAISNCDRLNTFKNNIVYSGYLNINSGFSKSGAFYIFMGKAGVTDVMELSKQKLLIWINSGPTTDSTSSSLFSFCIENGVQNSECFANLPDYLTKYFETKKVNNWNSQYNILYIDAPLGVGLSYVNDESDLPRNGQEIAQQFYNSLIELSTLKNKCTELSLLNVYFSSTKGIQQDIYLMGESLAGKYIPTIAKYIYTQNQEHKTFYINLKGIVIINGLNDPLKIITELPSSSWNLGIINFFERQKYERMLLQLAGTLRHGKTEDAKKIFEDIYTGIQEEGGEISLYNMFKYEEIISKKSYNLINEIFNQLFENYLNYDMLHVNKAKTSYNSNIEALYTKLTGDFMTPTTHDVEFCVNNKLRVLILQGQDDYICNNAGTLKWVEQMNWNTSFSYDSQQFFNRDFAFAYPNSKNKDWDGIKGLPEAQQEAFTENIIGYGKSSPDFNFQFYIVNKGGRFITIEQTQNTQDIVFNFLNKKSTFYGFQNSLLKDVEKVVAASSTPKNEL